MNGWSCVCWLAIWCIHLWIISCFRCIGHSYFLFIFWGLMNGVVHIKILFVYRSYFSFSFPQHVIHFSSNYHLMCYPQLCLYLWLLTGSLLYLLCKSWLFGCGWPCAHLTRNIPLGPFLMYTSFSLLMIFYYRFELPDPWFMSKCWIELAMVAVKVLLESVIVFNMQSTGWSHPCMRNLLVPGCPMLKQNIFVLLLHNWHAESLPV